MVEVATARRGEYRERDGVLVMILGNTEGVYHAENARSLEIVSIPDAEIGSWAFIAQAESLPEVDHGTPA